MGKSVADALAVQRSRESQIGVSGASSSSGVPSSCLNGQRASLQTQAAHASLVQMPGHITSDHAVTMCSEGASCHT